MRSSPSSQPSAIEGERIFAFTFCQRITSEWRNEVCRILLTGELLQLPQRFIQVAEDEKSGLIQRLSAAAAELSLPPSAPAPLHLRFL